MGQNLFLTLDCFLGNSELPGPKAKSGELREHRHLAQVMAPGGVVDTHD